MVTAAQANAVLTESAPLLAGTAAEPKGIWRSRIIEADVDGSSGHYPAEVLRRDGARAFPAGTHVYFDHPTEREEEDRPERSVRDLAGYFLDDAHFEEGPDGRGLFTRIQFTEAAKNHIRDLASVIGLSIRAAGEVENTAKGRIVRSISEGLSVDLVTRPGAGGRLVTMTESAKPDSPPAEGATTTTVIEESNSSASSTGALHSQFVSMRESMSDRIDQLSIEIARMVQALKESQKLNKQIVEENASIREKLESINDRQTAADHKLGESKKVHEVLGDLIKAGLPVPSLVRLAENYTPGQDLHVAITAEREYLKKVIRESERGELTRSDSSSNLGLVESAFGGPADLASTSVSKADFAEMDDVLSGKLY